MQEDDVRRVGLHGIGGIGKTTLANALYDHLRSGSNPASFEKSCFLEKIREEAARCPLEEVQHILLKDLVGHDKRTDTCKDGMRKKESDVVAGLHTVNATAVTGRAILRRGLNKLKVLLVLDNVDSSHAGELIDILALGQRPTLFSSRFASFTACIFKGYQHLCYLAGPGSVVIMTSRDLDAMRACAAFHRVALLDREEAEQLFRHYANECSAVAVETVNSTIEACQGLPLSLKVSS